MSNRPDFGLLEEMKAYGHINVEACFNCGNCTAICPLSTDETPFPRNNMRLLQVGLKERILESTDPWLCYYCGECSDTCPRGAEPAEAQMTLRRWLTAQYDWLGLGRHIYTSNIWTTGALLLIAVLVILGFAFFHGPIVTDRVELNTFAPVHIIHLFDLGMAAVIVLYLLLNVYRMHSLIVRKGGPSKIPIALYLTEIWNLPFHFITQKRYSECEDRNPWLRHLILVSGYVLMFGIIVIFLTWFQTDNIYPIYNPQRWLGYYAAGALLFGAGYALWGRFKKSLQLHKFSTMSDWLFPSLLALLTVSGLMVHSFRYLGLPLATYYTYVIHLTFVPMIYFVIGPMGKWAHMFYRPLAIYFQSIKEKALAAQTKPAVMPAGAD
jgi:ferredoxin